MHEVLKFGYFLMLALLFSCGDGPKKEQKPSGEESPGQGQTEDPGKKTILFFGDSLTAGYGIDTQEAFPALIQARLDSLGYPYTVINSGVSGETSSGGRNRLGWVLNQKVDVFVLELGANDGLRGIPLKETKRNLQAIIDAVKAKDSTTTVILAGMQIPPNMGKDYTAEFKSIFPDLAQTNGLDLIPFMLDGVAGIPKLNLEDGIHPTPEGHKIVGENVWAVLKDNIHQ